MTEVTGGELLTLWKVGRVELPKIAQVYLDAIDGLAAAQGTAAAFFGPAATGASAPPPADAPELAAGQVGSAWQRVCGELADVLSLCARHTVAAGEAVSLAITGYTGTDADGTGSLAGPGQELWRKIHDPNEIDPADPDQNPPAPSAAADQAADRGPGSVGRKRLPAESGYLSEVTRRAESIKRLVIEKQKADEDAFKDFAKAQAQQYSQDAMAAWEKWDHAYRDWHKEQHEHQPTTTPTPPERPTLPQSPALIAALQAEYDKHLEESYAWIVPAFQAWAAHDPDVLTPGIAAVKAAEDRLGDGQAIRFANSAQINLASQWDGGYCTSLRNFLASFLIMPGNQQTVARTLRELLEAEQALYRQAQGNMLQLAERAEDAIKACGTQNRPETKTYLTILSAVTWIAGAALAIPSGGASIYAGVVAFNAVAAVSGAAASLLPGGDPKSIGADKIDEVLANVSQVMGEARAQIAAREQDIITALEHNLQTLAAVRQRSAETSMAGPVTPSRPAIISASARQIAEHLHPK